MNVARIGFGGGVGLANVKRGLSLWNEKRREEGLLLG